MFPIVSVYYLILPFLPIVDGVLKVRIGAGWEPSVIFSMLLFLVCVYVFRVEKRVRAIFLIMSVISLFLIISNFFGMAFYAPGISLSPKQIEQVGSAELRMVVESTRYLVCVFVMVFTILYLDRIDVIMRSAKFFLLGASIEALYGVFEFLVKVLGLAGVIPLLRQGGNVQTIFRVYGTFFEPTNFGQFMACSFLFFFGYTKLSEYYNLKEDFFVRHKHVFFLLFLIAVLLSFSRMAFLAIVISIILKVVFDYLSLSLPRMKTASYWLVCFLVLSVVVVFSVYHIIGSDYLDLWLLYAFSWSGDVENENTAFARSSTFMEMLVSGLRLLAEFPLGIGQGMAFLESPFTPFWIRLPIETGVIVFALFCGVFLYTAANSVKNSRVGYFFMPCIFCLYICMVNYNSTNHIWPWFLIGFFLCVSNLNRRRAI